MSLETATVDGKAATTIVRFVWGGRGENSPDVNDERFHLLNKTIEGQGSILDSLRRAKWFRRNGIDILDSLTTKLLCPSDLTD
jgi:hypothetical protein